MSVPPLLDSGGVSSDVVKVWNVVYWLLDFL